MISPEELRGRSEDCECIHCQLLLVEAAGEIERLKDIIEVRSQSWMNTTDALSETSNGLKLALEEIRQTVEILKCLRSVLSEEGVKEYLLAYTQGVELIMMLEELK